MKEQADVLLTQMKSFLFPKLALFVGNVINQTGKKTRDMCLYENVTIALKDYLKIYRFFS